MDFIGRHILSKLMNDWKLMDELAVLRAIYLLGSGIILYVGSLVSWSINRHLRILDMFASPHYL